MSSKKKKKVVPLTEPEGRRGATRTLKTGKVRKLIPDVENMWWCAEQGDPEAGAQFRTHRPVRLQGERDNNGTIVHTVV